MAARQVAIAMAKGDRRPVGGRRRGARQATLPDDSGQFEASM